MINQGFNMVMPVTSTCSLKKLFSCCKSKEIKRRSKSISVSASDSKSSDLALSTMRHYPSLESDINRVMPYDHEFSQISKAETK